MTTFEDTFPSLKDKKYKICRIPFNDKGNGVLVVKELPIDFSLDDTLFSSIAVEYNCLDKQKVREIIENTLYNMYKETENSILSDVEDRLIKELGL